MKHPLGSLEFLFFVIQKLSCGRGFEIIRLIKLTQSVPARGLVLRIDYYAKTDYRVHENGTYLGWARTSLI